MICHKYSTLGLINWLHFCFFSAVTRLAALAHHLRRTRVLPHMCVCIFVCALFRSRFQLVIVSRVLARRQLSSRREIWYNKHFTENTKNNISFLSASCYFPRAHSDAHSGWAVWPFSFGYWRRWLFVCVSFRLRTYFSEIEWKPDRQTGGRTDAMPTDEFALCAFEFNRNHFRWIERWFELPVGSRPPVPAHKIRCKSHFELVGAKTATVSCCNIWRGWLSLSFASPEIIQTKLIQVLWHSRATLWLTAVRRVGLIRQRSSIDMLHFFIFSKYIREILNEVRQFISLSHTHSLSLLGVQMARAPPLASSAVENVIERYQPFRTLDVPRHCECNVVAYIWQIRAEQVDCCLRNRKKKYQTHTSKTVRKILFSRIW